MDSLFTDFVTWVLLLLFLVLTVWVSHLSLGVFNLPLALLIAVLKSALVIAFFMRLKRSEGLIKIYVAMGIMSVVILLTLTFSDILTR